MKRFINSIPVYGKEVHVYEADLGDEFEGFHEDGEVLISNALPIRKRKQTLLHEMLHALFLRLGIRQMNVSEEAEEVIVDGIATWITECKFIRFNFIGIKWKK